MPSNVSKFVVPFLGTVVMGILAAFTALQDQLGVVSITFIVITLGLAAINAATTFLAPKTDKVATSAKFWLNVGHVALQAIVAIIGTTLGLGDVSVIQWAGFGMAVLSALGVAVIPNTVVGTVEPVNTVTTTDGKIIVTNGGTA